MGTESPDYLDLVQRISQSSALDNLAPPLQIALFLGGLAFLTSAIVCLTSFTRIVIVLSFVRRALTTNEIPPNQVVIGLSMFLSLFVMSPTLERITNDAILPYLSEGEDAIPAREALDRGRAALQGFMMRQTRRDDIALFLRLAGNATVSEPSATPFGVLVPAFMISELKTAFTMGFCIYIPFLVIDLVVSSVLVSLGMMMMSPMVMSLPFKILLFVLVDGWQLVIQSLTLSFHAT